ncbi:DUF3787 domain-containing protein [Clostridium sp. cel8]|jgi:hypothetical protein|uniref:CDIF630_02480 family spore surface protein n=1 Tax=unclassified Clostridium TaxID=2614128 RepID=UPI0015F523AF|nr:DUF3787 domain-containing protein [Clostridium sp. cel8]MBA5851239.1 DUF3787 domain-containing protein [Clostridium sp. cel8]
MLRNKRSNRKIPIESHETAPWTNIKKTKPVSNVSIPDISEIYDSKSWVDENEK